MFKITRQTVAAAGALALMLIALNGCGWLPGTYNEPYTQIAPLAPPEPLNEPRQMPDNPQTIVWRPGYWSWNGSSFDWASGEWIARPAPTAVWSPDHWIMHTYGWAFVPGYWQ